MEEEDSVAQDMERMAVDAEKLSAAICAHNFVRWQASDVVVGPSAATEAPIPSGGGGGVKKAGRLLFVWVRRTRSSHAWLPISAWRHYGSCFSRLGYSEIHPALTLPLPTRVHGGGDAPPATELRLPHPAASAASDLRRIRIWQRRRRVTQRRQRERRRSLRSRRAQRQRAACDFARGQAAARLLRYGIAGRQAWPHDDCKPHRLLQIIGTDDASLHPDLRKKSRHTLRLFLSLLWLRLQRRP